MAAVSLQDRYAPNSTCFECAPPNDRGLRIKSVVVGRKVVCDWTPRPHHHAFGDFLNGGITGTILDCHSNRTAAHAMIVRDRIDHAPPNVTSEFSLRLLSPAAMNGSVHLRASVVEPKSSEAVVESTLEAGGKKDKGNLHGEVCDCRRRPPRLSQVGVRAARVCVFIPSGVIMFVVTALRPVVSQAHLPMDRRRHRGRARPTGFRDRMRDGRWKDLELT